MGEDKGEIAALRTKEQGDWKKLTLEEKKALYRASFCQTLAEVEAPTGEGKSILGCVLVAVSVGIWGYFWMKSVVYGELPDSITSDEKQGPDRPYDCHQKQPCGRNCLEL